jgi:hypothetical protein
VFILSASAVEGNEISLVGRETKSQGGRKGKKDGTDSPRNDLKFLSNNLNKCEINVKKGGQGWWGIIIRRCPGVRERGMEKSDRIRERGCKRVQEDW